MAIVNLAWDALDPADGVLAVNIIRNLVKIGAVAPPTTTFSDSAAPMGTDLTYTAIASNASGESEPSNAVTVRLPQSPKNLRKA